MDSKIFYQYCGTKAGVIEDYPFGPDIIVFKIGGKMFALMYRRDGQDNISLKCDPVYAEVLRKQYAGITPGYHLNKRCWNTLLLDGGIPVKEVEQLIDHSYDLVYNSLPRRLRSKNPGDF